MLHRSFKPAKCKTSLKLAVSRIKLLKNKKDAQVKQIKKELAHLLENGEYRTARIRVEHVVREEKTKAAFELIEIYCELIAARLPVIESQKNCPIDLKEAVASVIFASPRCADIPELMDIRKHFTAKYGKEFITGAVEMRPDCGVSRMLVEKLATKSPDGPTKMKILAAIAEEHNVKWDPEAFEEKESKPPEDLLNGPNALGMASRIHVEPPAGPPPPSTTQVPPHNYGNPYPRGPPPPSNLQVPPQNYGNHDVSMNVNEQNARSSPHFRDSASSNVSSDKETTSGTFHPERRSSGNGTDGMENRHSFPGEGNASSMGRQSWNMNFKDAASAAQAAAESAEMASMAARAAAELSRQHSSESQEKFSHPATSTTSRTSINNDPKVNIHQMADQYPQKKSSEPEKRDFIGEVRTKKQSSNTNVHASEMQTGKKPDNVSYFGDMRSEEKSGRPSFHSGSTGEASTKRQSSNTNVVASEMITGMKPDSFSYSGDMRSKEKSSRHSSQSGSTGEASTKRQSSDTNVFVSEMQTGMKPDSFSYSGDMRSEEKFSRLSSPSNSSVGSDDQHDVLGGNDQFSYLGDMRTGEQPVRSSSYSHAGNVSNSVTNASDGPGNDSFASSPNIYQSPIDAPLVFDDYYSDDDKCKFDMEDSNGPESSLFFPSPDRNSFSPSVDLDVWRSKQQTDELQYKSTSQLSSSSVQHSPRVFSETLTSPMVSSSPKDLLAPVAFDASDGPSSDSEEELDKSKFSQSSVSILSSRQSQSVSHRSSGSSSSEEVNVGSNQKSTERNQVVDNSTVLDVKFDYDEFLTDQPFPRQMKSGLDSNLKDGFQTAQSARTMKDSKASEERSSVMDAENELNYGTLTGGLRNKGYKHPPYARKALGNSLPVKQVSEDTKIEQASISPIVRTSILSGSPSQDPYNLEGSTRLVKERSRRTRIPYVASDDDSSEDEPSHGTISSIQEPYNKKLGSEVKASSRSKLDYFDSEGSEVEEDLLTKISTSNVRRSARLSRRTQPSSNSVRSSGSNTTVVSEITSTSGTSDHGKASLRSSYATETLPNPSSQPRNSDRSGSQEWNRPVEPAAFKPVPESQRSLPVESSKSRRNSSSRSSHVFETPPKPLSPTKSSESPGRRYRQAEQAAPKPIPESKRASLVETSKPYGNPSSRTSYATETLPKPSSQIKSLERPGSQERNGPVEQAAPKPIEESKRSSPVETSKPFAREQPSNPPSKFAPPVSTETSKFAPPVSTETSKFAPPGSIETSKSSGSTDSPSKEKASHVHPNLPDSDDFIAKFMALRQNR